MRRVLFVLLLGLACLCVAGLYWETFRSLVHAWAGSKTFSHGFVVLPVTAFLVWCYRSKWMELVPTPSAWGGAVLLLLGVLWHVTAVLWVKQAVVIAMLPALIWTILGKEIVTALRWPLGFLVFALPIGTVLNPWLQTVTVWLIQAGLWLVQVPFHSEPYRIILSSGTWDVAPACGGLRYLLPGLALGYAFTTALYREPSRRLVFLALCAIVLMLANGVRAYGVIVGHHVGITEGANDGVYGYVMYGLTMPVLFWVGLKWAASR